MGDEVLVGAGVSDGDITHTQREDVGQITRILFVFTHQGECG